MPRTDSDLTSRARILESALEQLASRGSGGTSLRMIAGRAGVSPSLISHHFRSKAGMEVAVMAWVVERLRRAAYIALNGYRGGGGVAPLISALADQLEASPSMSNFIRRSFCDLPTDSANPLHDQLRSMLRDLLDVMEQRRLVGSAEDPDWRAAQVLVVLFGTLVLRPARRIQHLASVPDETWAGHVKANIFLLEHGVIGSIGDPDSKPDQ